jgi:prepilin-type N-terminal cleavage/methylation domain-containing protein/prepilin-type processing-associated H-X9-DG protein
VKRRALTLIELIVVVAIIAILMAILLPVFAKVRQDAMKTVAMTQLQQLGHASSLYSIDWDGHMVPSTNYGAAETARSRIWPPLLRDYAANDRVFIAPGSQNIATFAHTWAERGNMSIGLNAGTAYDPNGCLDGQTDSTGCQGFQTSVSFDTKSEPTRVALFTTTSNGPASGNYRGYEFNPYNGLPNVGDLRLSPPLVADRDLIPELFVLPGDAIKAVFARYFADGQDNGQAPVLFADGHVKSFSAKAIRKANTNIIWRFR